MPVPFLLKLKQMPLFGRLFVEQNFGIVGLEPSG